MLFAVSLFARVFWKSVTHAALVLPARMRHLFCSLYKVSRILCSSFFLMLTFSLGCTTTPPPPPLMYCAQADQRGVERQLRGQRLSVPVRQPVRALRGSGRVRHGRISRYVLHSLQYTVLYCSFCIVPHGVLLSIIDDRLSNVLICLFVIDVTILRAILPLLLVSSLTHKTSIGHCSLSSYIHAIVTRLLVFLSNYPYLSLSLSIYCT